MLRDIIQKIAEKISSDEKIKESLSKWISTYDGKIIGFRTGGSLEESDWKERFHLILTREGARVGDGDYPSPDVIILAEVEDDLIGMFRNPSSAIPMIKSGKVWIMGNMNEAFSFFQEIVSRCRDVIK
jgi:hypothetical protein